MSTMQPEHLLDHDAADGRSADHLTVARVAHMAAGNVDADRYGDELFQFAEAAELAEHDLAEDEFAGGRAERRRHRVKTASRG